MKISYDYEDLLQELREELNEGILSMLDTIQVLRTEKPIVEVYRPIIDWYYNDKTTRECLSPDVFDDKQDIAEYEQLRKQYEKDKPRLESITVAAVLIEIEHWNKPV